jgi:hypothetical protein
MKKILTLLTAGFLCIVRPCSGQSLEARADFMSRYMLRGYSLSEGKVIQPSITAGYEGVTLVGFTNYDTNPKKINEIDLSSDYTTSIADNVNVSVGINVNTFPLAQDSAPRQINEAYGAISLTNILNPKIMVLKSWGDVKGTIAELSINPTVDIGGQDISTTLLLGYDKNYFNPDAGLSHAEIKLSTIIPITDNVSIIPMLNYTRRLAEGFNNELYGEIGVSVKY